MDSDTVPLKDNGELDIGAVVNEINLASNDIADFITWLAHQDDDEVDGFELKSVIELAYSYARARNAHSE